MSWPTSLQAEIAAEFGDVRREYTDGASVFTRRPRPLVFERDARGRFLSGRRGRRLTYRRDLETKRRALAQLGGGQSARAVARELGVNRATVTRWAREEGLTLRRGRRGSVAW